VLDAEGSDGEIRQIIYAGLYDLLVEACMGERPEDIVAELERAVRVVRSAEPSMHFAHSEQASAIAHNERAVRMRDRRNAMTREWLVPRLREDLDAYRRRIEALKVALAREGAEPL